MFGMVKSESFSDQVRRLFTESGCTSAEFQKVTGLTPSAASRFIHGERFLSEESLNKIAAYLDLEVRKRRS